MSTPETNTYKDNTNKVNNAIFVRSKLYESYIIVIYAVSFLTFSELDSNNICIFTYNPACPAIIYLLATFFASSMCATLTTQQLFPLLGTGTIAPLTISLIRTPEPMNSLRGKTVLRKRKMFMSATSISLLLGFTPFTLHTLASAATTHPDNSYFTINKLTAAIVIIAGFRYLSIALAMLTDIIFNKHNDAGQ